MERTTQFVAGRRQRVANHGRRRRPGSRCRFAQQRRGEVCGALRNLAYAGLRPSEAAALRVNDLKLPESGWGMARLRAATPAPGTRYTDDGGTRQTKALKHRADKAVRSVPLAPPLVKLLRVHLRRWPSVELVFTNGAGRSVTPENYGKVWNRIKPTVWPEGHIANCAVPYDLRHLAATVMLRAGVPLAEIARRLGHSIDVLLRVYAGVFEDDEIRSNEAIEAELGRQRVKLRQH